MMETNYGNRSKRWLTNEHNITFSQWLKDKVKASYGIETVDRVVVHLANGQNILWQCTKAMILTDIRFTPIDKMEGVHCNIAE